MRHQPWEDVVGFSFTLALPLAEAKPSKGFTRSSRRPEGSTKAIPLTGRRSQRMMKVIEPKAMRRRSRAHGTYREGSPPAERHPGKPASRSRLQAAGANGCSSARRVRCPLSCRELPAPNNWQEQRWYRVVVCVLWAQLFLLYIHCFECMSV